MTILEDEIINNKTLEHGSLIFTEPWALVNEIMLNIMQKCNSDFLENGIFFNVQRNIRAKKQY